MQFRHIFFDFFRNCPSFGGALMRTAAALRCPWARVGQSRFRGNLGSNFFRSKINFFNFDFDKKWFGGVWTHWQPFDPF